MVNTDVSEKKKIEAQFLRTQRMESIGTLAGGIAHDLNNVLSPILMSVEILKNKFKDDQSKRMLTILESSAKRGADMVKQVLTFARGVDGERVLLQTKHLIKEVAKIILETFPKTIQLKTNIAENLWTIMGDATQLTHLYRDQCAMNALHCLSDDTARLTNCGQFGLRRRARELNDHIHGSRSWKPLQVHAQLVCRHEARNGKQSKRQKKFQRCPKVPLSAHKVSPVLICVSIHFCVSTPRYCW